MHDGFTLTKDTDPDRRQLSSPEAQHRTRGSDGCTDP